MHSNVAYGVIRRYAALRMNSRPERTVENQSTTYKSVNACLFEEGIVELAAVAPYWCRLYSDLGNMLSRYALSTESSVGSPGVHVALPAVAWNAAQ
jgi:hypothetical protein